MSKIEWTEKTWNPVVGCDKVSAGCKNCYAIRMAYRLMHNPKMAGKYVGTAVKTAGGDLNWTGKLNIDMEVLKVPLMTKKPTVYFVNSMSDLFHEQLSFQFVVEVLQVISKTPQHTYQVLTKRPERMLEFFMNCAINPYDGKLFPIPKNLWLGVSVEDQKAADERIPYLLQIPASVRFLSMEPLLGRVDLNSNFYSGIVPEGLSVNERSQWYNDHHINWVIVGGESGPNSRPMHPDWARTIRDQCKAAGVPFFFKQWGAYGPNPGILYHQHHYTFEDGSVVYKCSKHQNGRLLDGFLHDEFPN
jgi:protein gp37